MTYLGKRVAIGLCVAGMLCSVAWADDAASPMQVGHLNLVFSVTDADAVHAFYGGILGLKRIPNIDFPGESYMIRYMGGESEIKFIVTGQDLPKHEGGAGSARGIRLLALLLPQSEQAGILERLKAAGHDVPKFTAGKNEAGGYSYAYGMVYDGDGNQIEVVFLGEGAPEDKFKQVQIGLNVSDMAAMDTFLKDILGFQPVVTEGGIHRYVMGASLLKFWEGGADLPAWVGGPMNKIGMNLVQFIVPDVDAVRTTVLERGGKIHTEPFPLGTLATIMFVEGPDGILFEFAGPLLERFKQ